MFRTQIVFLIILLKTSICMISNPCPNIFTYKYEKGQWYGEINITIEPKVGEALLQIKYSLNKDFENNFRGEILFITDKEYLKNNINKNRPIRLVYMFVFPSQTTLPVIEYIRLNSLLYCAGVDDPDKKVTATFNHRLTWGANHNAIPSGSQTILTPSPPIQRPNPPVQRPHYPVQTQQPTQPVIQQHFPQMTGSRPTLIFPQQQEENHDKNQGILETPLSSDITEFCGIIPASPFQLVVNGKPAGQQPWLVALYEGTALNYEFFCGGNLLSDRHVITAAHCVYEKKDLYFKIGAKSLVSTLEPNIKIRTHQKIFINPEYKHPHSHGDIAIILMNEPVKFAYNIRPLCLWSSEENENLIVGKIGEVIGWGKNENGKYEPTEPRKAEVRVVTQDACRQQTILQKVLSDKTICATGATHSQGPCLGDSGGALSMKINGRWTIRGVISATVGDQNAGVCNVDSYYSVYADVAKHLPWIHSVLALDS